MTAGRHLPRQCERPRPPGSAAPSFTPDALGSGSMWWWADACWGQTLGVPPTPGELVGLAIQQNPVGPAIDLDASPNGPTTGPAYVAASPALAGRPAFASAGGPGSLRFPSTLSQPVTFWQVISFKSVTSGTIVDGFGSFVGYRVDAGVLWITCAAGFTFGVPTAFMPAGAFGVSYFISIDYNGALTRLFVGVTEQSVTPGITGSPDVDNSVIGSGIGGSDPSQAQWGACGYKPGGFAGSDRADMHAWAQGLYGVV